MNWQVNQFMVVIRVSQRGSRPFASEGILLTQELLALDTLTRDHLNRTVADKLFGALSTSDLGWMQPLTF